MHFWGDELGGNRTHDPRIKSPMLYQLSYQLRGSHYMRAEAVAPVGDFHIAKNK